MSDTFSGSNGERRGVILALITDLFFSVTVRNTIRRLGFESALARSAGDILDDMAEMDVVLAVVDLNAIRDDSDWDAVADAAGEGLPILLFGAHRDVDGLRRAQAAGVTRVVSNGQFHREMPELIERYARRCFSMHPVDEDDLALDDDLLGSLPPGAGGYQATVQSTGSLAGT
jgi:hypothetical protein